MYHVTVFDDEGKKLFDEPLQAENDVEAREKGLALLAEKEYQNHPYRIVHTSGRLVAFNSHKGKVPK
ncbi:MAG: YhzD family protein [Planifilum fimeticola]